MHHGNYVKGFAIKTKKRCEKCGQFGGIEYHQRTCYTNPKDNLVCLCPNCKKDNDSYWDEMWDEYHRGLL